MKQDAMKKGRLFSRPFVLRSRAASLSAVIARLDRAIQYSREAVA
jgi:hypothetical protein